MTKRDEIINKLILTTSKEVDYWLLKTNKVARENEYGPVIYTKMVERYRDLRTELLKAVCGLAEILKEEDVKLASVNIKVKRKSLENHENNI